MTAAETAALARFDAAALALTEAARAFRPDSRWPGKPSPELARAAYAFADAQAALRAVHDSEEAAQLLELHRRLGARSHDEIRASAGSDIDPSLL